MTQQKLTAQVNGRQALFVRFPREHLRGDPNSILVEAAIRSAIPNGGTSVLSARRLGSIAGVDRECVANFLRKRNGVQSIGRRGFSVSVELPSRGWVKFPVAVLKAKAAPTLRVVLVALWDRPHTAQQLAERFEKTPRHIRRVLALLHRAGIARKDGAFWTLSPEAKLAWEQNPSGLARAVADLCPPSGGSMSSQAAGERGRKCGSGQAGIFDRLRLSLDIRETTEESEDAAAAASSESRLQLEERRRELERQLEEARKPASERLRRHILAYCRVHGGPVGNVLAAAVHAYWEEVNTATARRFLALLEARLPAIVCEVAAAEGPKQHQIARAHIRSAMAEACEDARTDIESLRVRRDHVVWQLEAHTEAARVSVFGVTGWRYEEAPGRKILEISERVAVEARAAWAPPGKEPVEVGRPAFFEARRELILARLGAEAGPTAARGEEVVPEEPLEGLTRQLFRLRELILNPPNLPAGGLS